MIIVIKLSKILKQTLQQRMKMINKPIKFTSHHEYQWNTNENENEIALTRMTEFKD
jgi:hypothetical protein